MLSKLLRGSFEGLLYLKIGGNMEIQATSALVGTHSATLTTAHVMRVKKRDGSLEPVDVTKIVERVTRCCQGLTSVDPLRVATKAISGLYDGASTKELDNLCIQTASLLIGEDPEYSRLAARLLSTYIDEEVLPPVLSIPDLHQSTKML